MNLLSSFLAGLLSTSFLFVLSFILVFGVKYLSLIIKEILEHNSSKVPPTHSPPQRKRKKRKARTQRSIEIDPNQIDKIYVKKSS